MFTEIVSRPLRWADDDWAHADSLTLHKTCLYADQDSYADVLPDMASGYMLFPKGWYCLDEVCALALLLWQCLCRSILHVKVHGSSHRIIACVTFRPLPSPLLGLICTLIAFCVTTLKPVSMQKTHC